MSKFDTLLEEYRKALAYPEQKRSELEPMIAALTEKEHAAKAAFNNAVNDGEDANALYMSWKAVKDELDMLQAKLEALAHSGIGKQVPLIAKQMEEEAHREAEEIQTEKAALFEKLEEVRYNVNHNIPMNHISEEEAAELMARIRAGLKK